MSNRLLRILIREEIKKLIQDEALFGRAKLPGIKPERDIPGIEPEFDEPGNTCPECEKQWPDMCTYHLSF